MNTINYRNITLARESRGMTQSGLSKEVKGLTQGNLSRIEKGLLSIACGNLKGTGLSSMFFL